MTSYPFNSHPNLTTFKQLIDINALHYPQTAAFQFQRNKQIIAVTYQELRENIRALCGYFCQQGLHRSTIAVLGENSYEWILTYFAAVMSDNIIVPIDKELSNNDIAHLLEVSHAELLVYSDSYADIADAMVQGSHIKAILPMKDIPSILRIPAKNEIITKETDLCAIIFTSGTTGTPKGVMLSQRNLMTDAVGACQNVYIAGPSLLTLPLHHTFAFTAGVLSMLVYHVPIFINKSLRTFQADMKSFRPQNMFLVPLYVETMHNNIWKAAKEQGKDKLLKRMITLSNFTRKFGLDLRRMIFKSVLDNFGGNLTLIVSGGAAIRQEYIDGMDDIGILVLNGYGITECAPVVAVNRNKSYKADSIGLPLPCNEVRIEDGELCVKGENVMLGYYEDPDATQAAIIDGWFKTGDLGYVDADGFLYVTGRKKNLIILSNGKNVSPEELEEKILGIQHVEEVVVYAKDNIITAEIFSENPDSIQEAITELNKNLPPYKRIQRVAFRDTPFEKTTTKKIKRSNLLQKEGR